MASPQTEERGRQSDEAGSCCGARKSRRIWSLWKSSTLAQADVCEHPLGYQSRVSMSGGLLFSSVHGTREAAEEEVDELKREALAAGWTAELEQPDDEPK
jgi:hypothetical protein